MLARLKLMAAVAVLVLAGTGCQMSSGEAATPDPAPRPPHSTEGGMCAGFAGFPCNPGLYCYMTPEQQRVADGAGVCKPIPQMCTKEYMPVCGVDGRTYGNKCDAAAHGVNVRSEGACAAG